MARARNNFAIARGDHALNGVLTFLDLRAMRPVLGRLNARISRYLRRYTLPVTTGRGPDRKILIRIPARELSRAPQDLQDALAPHLTGDFDALAASEPWLLDSASWYGAADEQLGRELSDDEDPDEWQ